MQATSSDYSAFFNYTYNGNNFISSDTLLASQSHLLAAFTGIQKKYFPYDDYQLKIGLFSEENFTVPYYLEVAASANLLSPIFNKDNLDIFYKSLAALFSLIHMSTTLNGKKPIREVAKDNHTIDLYLEDDQILNVPSFHLSIYKGNPVITGHITKSFEALQRDRAVSGISITGSNGQVLNVHAADIMAAAQPNPYADRENRETVSYQVPVFVKRATFFIDKNRPWEWHFIHNGQAIKAAITDKRFEVAVNKGRNFHKGSRLIVDLKKISKWDPRYQQYLIKGYEIIKVYEGDLPGQNPFQQNLFEA
ncbi:hypothetical protein [Mucilaginibacter sp.]